MKKIFKISLILANALVLSGTMFGSQEDTIQIPSDYAAVVPGIDNGKLKKDCLLTFDELYKKSLESNGRLIVSKQEGHRFVVPLVSYKISSPESCEFFVAGANQVNEQNIEFFNITNNVKVFLQHTPEVNLYHLGERTFKGDFQTLSNLGLVAQSNIPSFFIPVHIFVPYPVYIPFDNVNNNLPEQSEIIAPSIVEIKESLEEKKALTESIILKAIDDAVIQSEERKSQIERELLKEERKKRKKDKEKEEKEKENIIKDDCIGTWLDEIIKEEAPQILNELKVEKQKRKELENEKAGLQYGQVAILSKSKDSGQAMSRQMTNAEIVEQDKKKAALALAAVNNQDDDEVININPEADHKQKKKKKKKGKTEEQKAQEAQEELLMQQMQKEIDNGPIVQIPLLALDICKNIEKSTVGQLGHSINNIDKLMKHYESEQGYDSESSYTSVLSIIAYSLESLCEIVKNINELKNNHTFSFNSKLKVFDTEDFVLNLLAHFALLDKMHNEVNAHGKFFIKEKKHCENMQKALLSIAQAYDVLKAEADCVYLNIMHSFKKLSQQDQNDLIVKNQLYKIVNFLDKKKNKDFIDADLMKNIIEIDENIKIRSFDRTDLEYSAEKIVRNLKEMCVEILENKEFSYAEFQQLAMYSAYVNEPDNCFLEAKLISPVMSFVRNIYLIFSCIKEIQSSSEVINDNDTVQLLSVFEEDESFLENFLKVFIQIEELYKNQLALNNSIRNEKELRAFLIFFQNFYNEFLKTHQDILSSNIGYFLAKEQNQDKKNALKKIFHVFVCKIYKKAFTKEQVESFIM